jgi:ATP-dependent Clp protease ATP-binding subunit ClpC
MLLGLVHEGEGVAARALASMGIRLEVVREQVEEITGRGPRPLSGHIPFTPQAKQVLELSLREALQLRHHYIGTEHILLALIRERDGVAAQVLVGLGATLAGTRLQVIQLLHGGQATESASGAWPEPLPTMSQLLSQIHDLNGELERLRALLAQHGIDPDGT